MSNVTVEMRWIDGLIQDNLMVTIEVEAASGRSSARQKCDLDTECMRKLGEAMVRHSFGCAEERSFTIDDRFGATAPLTFVMHGADATGRVPLEVVFRLEDEAVGRYPSTVVVRAELGQLERFGRKLAALPGKGVGASCELNPEVI